MMERQTAESQHGGDESFDIEVGMGVYGADGHKLGTVAGFGSTHLHKTSHPETADSVTQAQSSTSYVTVDRREVQGRRGATTLCVPFRGVQDVTAEQGIVLNGTIITELHDQAERIVLAAAEVQPTPQGGRHRWVEGWRNGTKEDTTVDQRETDALRDEVETRERRRDGERGDDTANVRAVTLTHEPEFSLGWSVQEESAFDAEMRP